MILRRCDRCGADFTPSIYYVSIELPIEPYMGRSHWKDMQKDLLGMKTRPMDLCENCIKQFGELVAEWLNVPSASAE